MTRCEPWGQWGLFSCTSVKLTQLASCIHFCGSLFAQCCVHAAQELVIDSSCVNIFVWQTLSFFL